MAHSPDRMQRSRGRAHGTAKMRRGARYGCTLLLILVPALAQERARALDRYADQARTALAAKRWADAAGALEQMARLAPEIAEVRANLGLAYFFEGRPAEALTAFERAQKLKPDLPQAAVMIGLAKAEMGRCTEATGALTAAFERRTDEDTSRLSGMHLLRCYSQLKQADRALMIGETLLSRYPNDPEILYQVSRLHAERSSELMSSLLREAPDSAWMHYANAEVQESLDRPAAAAQEYRHALERDPRMPDVHYRLGRLLLRGSRTPAVLEEAAHEFQQELAVSASNSDAEYELGEIEREQGKRAEAMAHFGQAIRYHPEFVEARVAMAKTLLEAGKATDALPQLQEAERLDPANKVPHYLLASAYKTLGDPDQAAKEFALYRKLGAADASSEKQTLDSTEK